jgi:hypothetical protein
VKGGQGQTSDDDPEDPPAETRTGQHGGGQTVGPYSQESPPKYGTNGGDNEGDSESSSNSEKKGKDKTGEGLGPSEQGEVKQIPVEGLPADPETGSGKGGDDVGGRKLEKYKVRGVTQQQKDLVGRSFGTTTGADDKERPATGGTSGSVSTDPFNSASDDLGGAGMRGRRSGGGTVDRDAGLELLMRLGLWKPGEGPKEQPRQD